MEKKIIDIKSIEHVRDIDAPLTREGERIMMTGIDGKPLTPAQIADAMVGQAKRWDDYSKQADKRLNGMFLGSLGVSGFNSASNAGAIYGGLVDTIKRMDNATRQAVFAEIEKLKAASGKEIQAKGGSWNCAAGEIMKACNLINSVKADIEKEAFAKQKSDDGVTM